MKQSRAVRTDAERAADELEVYEARLQRAGKARDAARAAYNTAQAEYELTLSVRNHLRNHPALQRSDEPVELLAEPVAVDGPGSDVPQAATG